METLGCHACRWHRSLAFRIRWQGSWSWILSEYRSSHSYGNGKYEVIEGVGTIYTTDNQSIEVQTFSTEAAMQTYIEENELIPKEEQ